MDELRNLAQAMVALPHAVLAGTLADPPSLLFATSEDTGIDAGRTLREAVTKLGGRGGGSTRIAQGSVPDTSRIAEAVASMMLAVE